MKQRALLGSRKKIDGPVFKQMKQTLKISPHPRKVIK
jgi:hypothetical protein